MKTIRHLILLAAALAALAATPFNTVAAEKIRILLVVGGHSYDTNQFHAMFRANPDIEFRVATHTNAHALWRPDAAKEIDVLVFYDLWQAITPQAKEDFLAFLKAGKGLVVMHHAIANYQAWPEYEKIIGGKYYLQKTMVNGVEKARSIYKHDVMMKVHIADPNHPVTRGVQDFEIRDETYGLFDMGPDSHLLVTSDTAPSAKNIGWAKTWESARVVYLQLGHDRHSYASPEFQKLIAQSIRWTAKKD